MKIDKIITKALRAACLIPLTQGKFALVDAENYDFLAQWHWSYKCGYAFRNPKINGKYRTIHMHREIMGMPKIKQIDHIDGNGLNNTKGNLRLVTNSQNQMNSKKRSKKASSEYKGVHFGKREQKWVAQIGFNGKRKCLGYFDSEFEAASAYNEAAVKLHGEYARLNDLKCVKGGA